MLLTPLGIFVPPKPDLQISVLSHGHTQVKTAF